MSRRDPGAATGGTVRPTVEVCACQHLEALHRLTGRRRTACSTSSCGCKSFRAASVVNVVELFPGAGVVPAPGPGPSPADLDAISDRYTDLLEARARGDQATADLLAHACADDIPALREEIHRVELSRRALAAEVARLRGGA